MAGKGQAFRPDRDVSAICQKLWDCDENCLMPGVHYKLDPQGYTFYSNQGKQDRAKRPLFEWVEEAALDRPTYKSFVALLDNYETATGVSEVVTPEEIAENKRFLNEIMKTKVMKEAHHYLVKQFPSKIPKDDLEFKKLLYKLWFDLYPRTKGMRGKPGDSSGFEHVFVGESKDGEVTGFHNWIQFYLQEKAGHVDYKGWVPPRGKRVKRGESQENKRLMSLQFTWKGDIKPVGSSFIGTSPEFEVALYTVLYFLGKKSSMIEMDEYDLEITVHTFDRKPMNILSSSYPTMINTD
ncbi:poly(U)-specific endoribonuclease-B-like [Patiria miniata]|uniref:Uridylate-specific endoribonuclease n=1 Tax=Patiria miniata TaxID=46514 RepID=A0A913ZZ75_PATMI|nr:poly(U)-specific endoribonuclease-B-like [Patiria miniata]XP_038056867.1 poly(U)-specific endoribonuclease-B-like [Patiria miniata]